MRQIVRTVAALGVTAGVLLGAGPVAGAEPATGTASTAADPADGPDAADGPAPDRSVLPEAPPATTSDPSGDPTAPGAPAASADQVLVQFAPGVDPAAQTDALADQGVAAEDAVAGTGFLEVPVGDADPADVVAALDADPRVEAVQLDVVRTAQAWPADELGDLARPYLDLLRLPRAWDVTTGAGQVIAVLDTGVDLDHPDLAGHLVAGYDAVNRDSDPDDDQWHGTAVAGVAAAIGGNRQGAAGAAHGARIMPVKVLDDHGSGFDSDVALGIRWAVDHGADVINLSLGGPGASPVLRSAIADAVARGVVVLAAAGNSGTEVPEYPAAYAPGIDGLLSVGATDDVGTLTPFSTWGDTVTVTAPGSALVAPSRGGGYLRASGTSFATPLVSGAAALLTARGSTPAQVEAALVSTARDAGPRGRDPFYGAGVVDAAAALGLGVAAPVERAAGDGAADDSVPARARALTLRTTVTAALSPEGDEDWYAVEVPAAGWYSATVRPTGAARSTRPLVTTLAADGEVLATGSAAAEGSPLTLAVPVPAAGTIRLGVANVDGSRGDRYTVSLVPASDPRPPVGTGARAWRLDASLTPHQAGVAVRPTLTVTSGRALAPGSASGSTVQLLDGVTGGAVPGQVAHDPATGVVSLTPSTDLVPGRHYQLRVGGLTDTSGAVQPSALRIPFTVAADGDRFTPVHPWRALDTRIALGASGPVRASTPVRLDLGDRVPADATAVVLNVTAVQPGSTGWVRVYPTPDGAQADPAVSNLNVVAGVTQPNAVTVALGAGGDVTLATSTTTHLLADVAGYYRAGGATGYTPLDPVRVLDTRSGAGAPRAAVRGGGYVDLVVRGRNGVPADATAVVLNVTGVSPSTITNVRVYPAPAASEDQAPPTVSNLNLVPGRAQPNLVTVMVGDGGRVRLWSQSGTVDLVADLAGSYSPTGAHGFVPLPPARIVDSRRGDGLAGPLRAGSPARLVVAGTGGVPADAAAVVLNVTAVRATAVSDLRVYPARAGGAIPLVSNLNFLNGRDEPNLVVTRLGPAGAVQLYVPRGDLQVVVDVFGYFRL